MFAQCTQCQATLDMICGNIIFGQEDDLFCSEKCQYEHEHHDNALSTMADEGCPHHDA